ncbi:hypothetical protein UPYG_G00335880 [Umbra pygmaea]|uniref:Uncharacterized protein n=1 Tax=Umbra pygmaea TaxID=75934 RepID=A0ABD0VWR2_UMBPY
MREPADDVENVIGYKYQSPPFHLIPGFGLRSLSEEWPSRTLNNLTQLYFFSSSNGHLITIFASSLFQREKLAFSCHNPAHKSCFQP